MVGTFVKGSLNPSSCLSASRALHCRRRCARGLLLLPESAAGQYIYETVCGHTQPCKNFGERCIIYLPRETKKAILRQALLARPGRVSVTDQAENSLARHIYFSSTLLT